MGWQEPIGMLAMESVAAGELESAMEMPRLRGYQKRVARTVLDALHEARGGTITVEIARQGGKNEAAARIEAILLATHAYDGGEIVKCAPTRDPQLNISRRRLWARLQQAGLLGVSRFRDAGIEVWKARIHFLSAEPHANVAGHTASVLLVGDEAQDIDADKFDRDFRPMAAAYNAPTVLFGTAWDGRSLLERHKQENLEAERRDGLRRHFAYPWTAVAKHVPAYAAYVESERLRLGETHPLFLTQYCLQPIEGGGRLFSREDLQRLRGSHERLFCPRVGERYVAGLDIAGGDDPDGTRARGRDSTVLTFGRLVDAREGAPFDEPNIEVVDHMTWTGTPHEELLPALIDALRLGWNVERVAVDATGIGETLTRLITQKVGKGRVTPVKFTRQSKSRIGYELLAAAQCGRLSLYRDDGSPEFRECRDQLERARVSYGGDRSMGFAVDPNEGHDDYLVSLALLVHAGRDRVRRRASGRVREAVL
jgi:hypothetical protein